MFAPFVRVREHNLSFTRHVEPNIVSDGLFEERLGVFKNVTEKVDVDLVNGNVWWQG